MKQLEMTMRLRNNRLKQRRAELGFSQTTMASAVGIGTQTYQDLENIKESPVYADGSWTDAAVAIAKFHCVECSELFPDVILSIRKSTVVRRVDDGELGPLLSDNQRKLLSSPELLCETADLNKELDFILTTLTQKEEKIIRMRYGMDTIEPWEHTQEEVGKDFEVSKTRIYQTEKKAFRKLRHPSRAKRIKPE